MNRNISSFLLMHLGFLIYSFYSVVGKIASKYSFLSFSFCIFYFFLIFILFVYALLWQQILKKIQLSVATANKAATIIWGMFWSALFFGEKINTKKIGATIIIFIGIAILSFSNTNKETEKSNE